MKHWLQNPMLCGTYVTLDPLRIDHAENLLLAASDGELWNLWYTSVPSKDNINGYMENALSEAYNGLSSPYVIIENSSKQIIGSTRFCNASPIDRRLEIGYTWYAQSFQGTMVNTECKLLMLQYAFERLDCIAVEFRTHWFNESSRRAILRLGAKQDGVLRNHRINADGSYRDTVVYSIIESEWPSVKNALNFKLKR